MALAYPEPPLTDGVVLLRPWEESDVGAVRRAARVQATVEPWNVSSQRVLENVGFMREGYLRSDASYRGERRDVFLYSLIPSDLAGAA